MILQKEIYVFIAAGDSAGDAYCNALSELMKEDDPDDATIKTLAEFSLYGDPSARTGKNKSKSFFGKTFSSYDKGISVPMPDIRKALKTLQISQDCKVVKEFQKVVQNKGLNFFNRFDYMQDIEPEFFQIGCKNLYVANYNKNIGHINQCVKVYFDERGNVKKELHSK